MIRGIAHRPRHARTLAGAVAGRGRDQRHGLALAPDAGLDSGGERGELLFAREIQPGGIAPLGAEQRRRQIDLRVRRTDRRAAAGDRHRVLDQFVDRHIGIGDAIDEGSIGAVLEQPAHQVGEQRLVAADRRVDAAGAAQLVRADHFLVERLAHAVQALELVLAGVEIAAGHLHHRRQRVRVVRRELREHGVRRGEQPARAGEIGDVGVHLARVHREILEPVDLGALDLAVPVGALDQADHQPVARTARQVDDPVDHEGTALLVGLQHEADAAPAREPRVEAQRFEQIERDLEPVGLLGVDVERDVVAAREHRELGEPRQQLGAHAPELRARVARMERRELHRDAGPLVHAAAPGVGADGVDRALVVGEVARRIRGRGRRLAQAIEAVAEAARGHGAAVGDRLVDVLAGDELLAHHAQAEVDALADQRLAALADEAGDGGGEPALGGRGGELAGDEQAPGGGVDEQRRAVAEVRLPVGRGNLVADQRIARGRIRDAQQRLGEAHEGDALLARERVFLDQARHAGAAVELLLAQRDDQLARQGLRRLCLGLRQAGRLEQRWQAFGFGPAAGGRDARAQFVLRPDVADEFLEGYGGTPGLIDRQAL